MDNHATQTINVKDWNNLESLDWDADGKGFFVASGVHGGMVLLHVDLQGNAHVLQEKKELPQLSPGPPLTADT